MTLPSLFVKIGSAKSGARTLAVRHEIKGATPWKSAPGAAASLARVDSGGLVAQTDGSLRPFFFYNAVPGA